MSLPPRPLRYDLLRVASDLTRLGLNKGTAGNVSVRFEDGLLITPSGVPAARLSPALMVEIDGRGGFHGEAAPSSEWRFHRDIYAHRPDVGAVVHTHAPFCTALACQRRGIPAFHYMIAVAGGKTIRCADYATFGSQELSDAAVAALEGRRACLLANHGMIATGANLDAALKLAQEVEELAEQYWRVLQLGEPILIDDAEMDRVLEKFRSYGQPRKV
ncbi:L-fuculose-1-phosphate aldolase [uncultured Alphaproteobacteria bacterium]|uniref:L-fuculose-1-phosphate aldolase n=1 Tax=uncultured Alphaproteobacteria bacterium TaxID=91750 RepID=A0A212JWS0_9PROT|nr:L-fuculose-1-phosphate aldolase [uncultured Alphaproteobacteria bacterium]